MTSQHFSQVSKIAATENITKKMRILEKWLANGVPIALNTQSSLNTQVTPVLQPEYFPKTIRQFKLWDGQKNSEEFRIANGVITRTGNDTLNKRQDLKELTTAILIALKEKESKQNKYPKEASSCEELKFLKHELKIRNLEIVQQQLKIVKLKAELERTQAVMKNNKTEYLRILQDIRNPEN
jgi:hypothetical protein